tara:strand:- start:1017 stop:1916 length:900 start_codon:yes stop_codon:yes gene_type:complete
MKVLVTGSSGFIGKQVFDYLLKKKYDVYGVSRKPTNKKNIFKFSLNEKNKIIECFEKIQFDAIIHLASLVPSNHQIDPTKIFQNCKNTLNLLDCCRKFKVKKFVFAGAHLVYGKTQYLPIDENHSTIPTSNYGSVKLIEENLCRMFYNTYKQNCIILRISSVYGPTQPGRHIIPTMMKNVIENKSIFVNEFSNGLQLMDLIHVNDVCQALELACKTKEEFFVGNIASGKGITAKEIARIISNISGNKKIHVQKIDEVTNHFIYDIENSAKILKFRPKEKIDEKSLAKWYKILEKEFKCK